MRLLVIASILAFLPSVGLSLTIRTQDMMFVSNAKYAIELFRDEHGHFPNEWSDLDSYFDRGVEEVGKHIEGTERYQLISPPASFTEPFTARLVAISRRSFSDTEHDWTWYGSIGSSIGVSEFRGIVLTSDDTLLQKTFSDAEMARLLQSAGDLKIVPDSLAERSHVASLRRKILVGRGLTVLVAGFLVISIARFIARRQRHNKSAMDKPDPVSS